MKMLARLRYLLEEGFDVASISGYDDASGEGNARIVFLEHNGNRRPRLRSEIFDVDEDEMEECSHLFLASLPQRHSR